MADQKTLMEQMRSLLAKGTPPPAMVNTPTPPFAAGGIGPGMVNTPAAGQSMGPSPEALKREAIRNMEIAATQQRAAMARVAQETGELLKGFSPTALAKVIARDAELTDLITKAMFLVPAFQPEKPA